MDKTIHEKYLLLEKAELLMLPSKNKEQGIEFVMSGLPVTKEQATKLVETVLKVNGLHFTNVFRINSIGDKK